MSTREEELFDKFKKIEREYSKFLTENLKKYSFSPNEISVLCALSEADATSQELVSTLSVSKGLISRSVKALKGKGFVQVAEEDLNKREQTLQITYEGEIVAREIEGIVKLFYEKAFHDFPEQGYEIATGLLKVILRNLEN